MPNLWFACGALSTKTTEITKATKNDEECWIRGNHANHGNDENHGNLGCKPRIPQATGFKRNALVMRAIANSLCKMRAIANSLCKIPQDFYIVQSGGASLHGIPRETLPFF